MRAIKQQATFSDARRDAAGQIYMHGSYTALTPSARPVRPSTVRSNSPPRAPLRVVSVASSPGPLQLSLTSLGGSHR
jgi:hypothetical protein